MQSVDGDIRLNVTLNTKTTKSNLSSLGSSIKNALKGFKDTSGIDAVNSKTAKLKSDVEKSAEKIDVLKAKLKELKDSPAPTKEYKALENEINKIARQHDKLMADQDLLAQKNMTWSKSYSDIEEKMGKLDNQLFNLIHQQKELESEGKAFVKPEDTPKYAQTVASLHQAEREYDIAKQKVTEFNSEQDKSSKSTNNIGKSFKSIAKSGEATFKHLKKTVSNVFNAIRSSSAKSTDKTADNFEGLNKGLRKGIRLLVKYGLGMRSTFILFRKLRSAVIEGYKNLAKYSSEVNSSVSSVSTSLQTLKNATASAFQPLVTAVTPFLNTIIKKFSDAALTIGKFFATLTGQDYVYEAVDVQKDFAKSLDGTANSVDKASKAVNDYLSPLDDLNKFTDNASTPADTSANDASKMFKKSFVGDEFKEIANEVRDFIKKVKQYFKDIFQPVKQSWDKYGEYVISTWKNALKSVFNLVVDIANSFRSVWTNGSGERAVSNILQLLGLIGESVKNIVNTFKKAWDKNGLGTSVIQAFVDKFNNLLDLVRDVIKTFNEVWTNGTGERIWAHILKTVKNIQNIIGSFYKILKKAWDKNKTGKAIWQAILDIVDEVTGFFESLSKITLDWVKKLDLSPITKSFKSILDAVKKLVKVLSDKFKVVYKQILLPFAKWTIEEGVPKLIEALADALSFVAKMIGKLSPTALQVLASAIGALGLAIIGFKAGSMIASGIMKVTTSFKKMLATIQAHPIMLIVTAVTALISAIHIYNETKWENSSLKKEIDNTRELTEQWKTLAQEVGSKVDELNNTRLELKVNFQEVDDLKERLKEIIADGTIDDSEIGEYRTIIDLMSEKVDGFDTQWNTLDLKTVNGKIVINDNIDEVNKRIDAIVNKWELAQAKMQLSGMYSTGFTEQKKAQAKLGALETGKGAKLQKQLVDRIFSKSALSKKESELIVKELVKSSGDFDVATQSIKKQLDAGELSRTNYKNLYALMHDDVVLAKGASGMFNALFGGEKQHIQDTVKQIVDYNDSVSQAKNEVKNLTGDTKEYNHMLNILNGEQGSYNDYLKLGTEYGVSHTTVLGLLKDKGVKTWNDLKQKVKEETNANKENANTSHTTTKQILDDSGNVVSTISRNTKTINASAHKNAGEVHTAYKKSFSGITTEAGKMVKALIGIFTGKTTFQAAIKSLWEVFKWGLNNLIKAINMVVGAPFKTVNALLAKLRKFKIGKATPFSWVSDIWVPQIPLLAKGAVIPPNREFMAVLGDQKNGTNIETPEALLRKIIQEETSNKSNNTSNVYKVPINIGRKTLFTLIIDEAKLAMGQTGVNPFEIV